MYLYFDVGFETLSNSYSFPSNLQQLNEFANSVFGKFMDCLKYLNKIIPNQILKKVIRDWSVQI